MRLLAKKRRKVLHAAVAGFRIRLTRWRSKYFLQKVVMAQFQPQREARQESDQSTDKSDVVAICDFAQELIAGAVQRWVPRLWTI